MVVFYIDSGGEAFKLLNVYMNNNGLNHLIFRKMKYSEESGGKEKSNHFLYDWIIDVEWEEYYMSVILRLSLYR